MASKTGKFKKNNTSRNLGAIIGSILILLIVIISFVVVPAISELGQQSMADIELGSYGKEKINFSFIKETPFRQELATLSSSNYGSNQMDYRLAYMAFTRAVTKAAAIEEFNSNGYLVTKEQLDDAVINSGYYNVNGSFSAKVFKNTTEAQKQELRDNIKRDLKVGSWQYHTLLQQKRSSAYLEFISSMSNVKRNFDYVTYDYSEYPEDLLLEYGKKDPKLFTELSLSRITVETAATADEVIEKLKNSEATFADLAAEYSTDNFKSNGGKMSSTLYAYELESVFGIENIDDLLSLTVDGTPYMVEQDGKVVLLTINEEIKEPTFDDLSTVRSYMLSYERGMIEDYFFNLISSNDSNNLVSLGKEIKETGLFSINYGGEQVISSSVDRTSQNSLFSRAVNNDNFFTTLFTLKEGVVSEPIVLGDTLTVFSLKEEVVDETSTEEYLLANFDRVLVNNKSSVMEKLILSDEKFTDNFWTGYQEILTIDQGL